MGEVRGISHLREFCQGKCDLEMFCILGELNCCPSLCRAYLVPSYSFGENEVYNQETFPEGTWLRFIQRTCQKIGKTVLRLNLCTFHGRGFTRGSWGFLPFNQPITTVGELLTFSRLSEFLIPCPKSSIRSPADLDHS
jgi:hypothetical protein